MPHRLKRVGRLIGGFEYQHHVAAIQLLQLLTPGTDALATTIEADDGGVLDDVRQRRRDRTDYIQVKWGAGDTPAEIGVDVLTSAPAQILRKLCRDWAELAGPRHVVLWSNRPIGRDLASIAAGARLRRAEDLRDDQRRVWDRLQAASGVDAGRFAEFARDVVLQLGGPTLDELVHEIDQRLEDLGIGSEDTPDIRRNLLAVVRQAAMDRHEPFLRADLVSALGLGPQRELPENLSAPEFGYVDRPDELRSLWDNVRAERAGGIVAVVGRPGVGKSAFMAQAIAHPPDDVVVIAEHFAFLPRFTLGTERVEESVVVETLLSQIERRFGSEEVRVGVDALHRQLLKVGADLGTRGKIGVVAIDALDELVDFRDEPIRLFDTLVPEHPPANVVFVLSAQSVGQFNPRLRVQNRRRLEIGPLSAAGARALVLSTGVEEKRAGAGLSPLTGADVEEAARRAGRIPLLLILIGRRLAGADDVEATLAEEPVVADGDVGRTFGALWTRCTATARFLLAALCVSDEPLSARELADVADVPPGEAADALKTIEHALARNPSGFTPYHRYLGRYVSARGDDAIELAAGATAALFARLPEDPRSIRSKWALLRRAGDDGAVLRECGEDIIDQWLTIGAPTRDIERNLTLAYDAAGSLFPSVQFARVALVRGTFAQRLQDLPMDDYLIGLHAASGIDSLRRHLFVGATVVGDRRGAAAASLVFRRARHHDEANGLAVFALRDYEPREARLADDSPEAVEALVPALVDLAGAVDWATGSYFLGRPRLVSAIARGARASGSEDKLVAIADGLEPGPRRTMRRAIVCAALDDPAHAAKLANGWRAELIPDDLSDEQQLPNDGYRLALAPTLLLELTPDERQEIAAASRLAARFLELRELADDVRSDRRSIHDLITAMATGNAPRYTFANDAFVELIRWAVRGHRVTAPHARGLAAAALAVSPALLGTLNVLDALRVARFDDAPAFALPIADVLGGADEGPTRVMTFCAIASFCADQGAAPEARALFRRAIEASRLFGWHKDISLEFLVDSIERAYARLPALRGDVERWVEQLLPCAELLPRLTDMDEHRGTRQDLLNLLEEARAGRVPAVTDFYGSEGIPIPLDRDWRRALEDLYTADLDGRASLERMLLNHAGTVRPAELVELGDAIIARRDDSLKRTNGDRLLSAVVRREIALEVEGWRVHARALVRAGFMHFRFWSGAFNGAMDALIQLGRRGDAAFDALRREVYMTERAQSPWAAWDIVPQQGEIAAGLGDAAAARAIFDLAVSTMGRRFAASVP